MNKFLILGGDGSLALEFASLLRNKEVISLNKNDLDITDEGSVREKIFDTRPDVIINCAAYNAVDKAELEPEKANSINGYALGFIGAAAGDVGATVIHFSTNYVFDGTKQEGYKEDDQTNPQSVYGKSKLLGETELARTADRYYIIRTAWLYGEQGTGETSKKNFVQIMLGLAKDKTTIECVSDQFGQPTFTKDLTKATINLIQSQKPSGIYHLTNSGEATWYSWAQEIFRLKNLEIKLKEKPTEKGQNIAPRPQYGILHNTKFNLLRPWQEALQDYLKDY